MNALAIVVASSIWYERQEAYALAIGGALLGVGLVVYKIGISMDSKKK